MLSLSLAPGSPAAFDQVDREPKHHCSVDTVQPGKCSGTHETYEGKGELDQPQEKGE
jgi:hypothetical protein